MILSVLPPRLGTAETKRSREGPEKFLKTKGLCLFTNRALESVSFRTSLTLNDLYV